MEGYTTAEMLERLGLEDEAVNEKGWKVGYNHKGDLLTWPDYEEKPGVSEGNKFHIYYPWLKSDKWKIRHALIDFEEAQRIHAEEKKTIVYHHEEGVTYQFVYGDSKVFQELAADGVGLNELVGEKWSIVND